MKKAINSVKKSSSTNLVITTALILVILSLAAIGYQSNRAPSQVGHSAEEIEVAAGQTLAQYVAAQGSGAITCRNIPPSAWHRKVSGYYEIPVPQECIDKACYVIVPAQQSSTSTAPAGVATYIQSSASKRVFIGKVTDSLAALQQALKVYDQLNLEPSQRNGGGTANINIAGGSGTNMYTGVWIDNTGSSGNYYVPGLWVGLYVPQLQLSFTVCSLGTTAA